jgi:SH3-like domain-containing protein
MLTKFLLGLSLLLMPVLGLALDFKSVAAPRAILYDAPSQSATKLYILGQFYPVEVIVNLGAWLKVRDAQGGIHWVESKMLSTLRTVLVTAQQADIRQEADANTNLVATVEQDVALEVVDLKPVNGWLKVKHIQGVTGFIPLTSVWGLH